MEYAFLAMFAHARGSEFKFLLVLGYVSFLKLLFSELISLE